MATKRSTSRQKKASLAPNYCEIPFCRYDIVVQKHRIVPGRDGGKYRLGNVIALCPNHHVEADRTLEGRIGEGQPGYLPNETLLALVLRRIEKDAQLQREQGEQRARELEEQGRDVASQSGESAASSPRDAGHGEGSGELPTGDPDLLR